MVTQTPEVPPQPQPTVDPYPNKAIGVVATTLVTVGVQWAVSGELSLDQEGITAIGGALATLVVYAVSNWKRLGR